MSKQAGGGERAGTALALRCAAHLPLALKMVNVSLTSLAVSVPFLDIIFINSAKSTAFLPGVCGGGG